MKYGKNNAGVMKMKLKRKISQKSISAILCTVIFITAFSVIHYSKKAADYKMRVDNQYQRSFAEIVQYVNNIETNLAKGAVVTNPKSMIRIAGEIYNEASQAEADLGQLMISDAQLDNMMRFLSQVGDYTYSLSMKYIEGGEPTEEENNTLLQMSEYASNLNDMLVSMQDDVYSGKISMDSDFAVKNQRVMANEFENIESKFADYPSLIYDGPFSSHIENSKPQLLKGQREYTKEEAAARLKEIVGKERYGKVTFLGENTGKTPSYSFSVKPDESDRNISVELTKAGNALVWMLDNRTVAEIKISPQEAVKKAEEYLKIIGLTDMQESYYEIKSCVATINFTCTQDGVVIYPDLIKVKIAMDTGEVLGLEAAGYIANHRTRTFSSNIISEQEARAKLSKTVTAEKGRLALIPLDSKKEVLCYEFKAKTNKNNFLIYINAETGKEEDVLLLMITESGTLTI